MLPSELTIIQDENRIAALRSLCLLDTPADPAFDRLTRLASKIMKVPIALVSLIDADRHYFKSSVGLGDGLRQIPLSHSYCRHVVTTAEPLIIEDAREHPLVYDNPALLEYNALSYIGIPINTSHGDTLGSFCIIDHQPRKWTSDEVEVMRDLAASVMTEIELREELIERQQMQVVLEEREHFIDQVLNTSPDIIYVYDLTTHSNIFSNREITEVIGYTSEEVQAMGGQLFQRLIHPDDLPRVLENTQVFASLADQQIHEIEYRMRHRNGEWRWLYSRDTVFMRDSNGTPLQIVGMAQDVTERKLAQMEQQALYDRVSELEQLKTDMIRVAAHDLRSPLATILPSVSMIEEDPLTQEQRECAELIKKSVRRMSGMIEDILSLERMEAQYQQQKFDIANLVREVSASKQMQAEQKQLQLQMSVPDNRLIAQGDAVQLREVIDNLISNAIKYTPEAGSIQVRLAMSSEQKIIFEVEDNGYGIPDSQQTRLFSAFYRASTKETRKIEGTGLGLHLVKRIIERHGGKVHFHSIYGQGSTFGFSLPNPL